MNCEWVKENVVLYIYDELGDDAKYEFEHHVKQCLGCRQELEHSLEFKNNMSALPVQEVSPNLLAASRMKLQESLEHADQTRSGWGMFVFDAASWMHQIKLAPALTAALLMIGFAGGAITSWRMGERPIIAQPGVQTANINSIESVLAQPNSNSVQIKYDVLTPQTYVGSADDPLIQKLLLLATQNIRNPDVRLGTIDILKSHTQDDQVREALVSTLRYDKNPGVRLTALDALKSYVRDDQHVRDAVVEALLHDSNPGVRQEAISLLDSVKADTSVREALRSLLNDQNAYIRSQSQHYLASTPNLD
jgi:hypothetical protein